MNRIMQRGLLLSLTVALLSSVTSGSTLSVCSYEPPESRVSDLGILGSFNWYDGPYADDRNRALSASLVGDYKTMISSASFGRAIDARTEIRADDNGWTADLSGSGSLSSFFGADSMEGARASGDLFGVGAVGFSASTRAGIELDLTGGIGAGRFRDVTPLAQAIWIQNELLDLGELLAPVTDDTLLELAQILGGIEMTDDEKVVALVDRLATTELLAGEDLGIRGSLAIEDVLASGDETRLCGRDIQARLGVSATVYPEFSLASTGILRLRYAAVPDPISQFDSGAEVKIRLMHPEQMSIQANVSYVRRLPDGWMARAAYRVIANRGWTSPGMADISHAASGSLTTQIFDSVGLSLVGSAQYHTGDDEVTLTLALYMETDLF
mgnify:CR=1 FL=1